MPTRRVPSGFTLIELVIVGAIIGVLSAIAIPKFANAVRKAREAAIKGKLGSINSALSIYYADNEGIFPTGGPTQSDLKNNLFPKYLDPWPRNNGSPTGQIPGTTHVMNFDSFSWSVVPNPAASDSLWPQNYNPFRGRVFLLCTHCDLSGTPWSSF